MAQTQTAWLRDRRVLAFALVVLCGLVVYFVWFVRGKEAPLPTTAQIMAEEASQPAQIAIGPNVHLSAGKGAVSHREVQAAADPTDPRRLFVAAICFPYADASIPAAIGYRSEDGGKSWQPSFRRDRPDELQFDLAVAFGSDGMLYLEVNTLPSPGPPGQISNPTFRFFRSLDAGKTWEAAGTVEGNGLDRPYLAVDRSAGPNRGHLYCASLLQFHASADQGRTFTGHRYTAAKYSVDPMPSNPVVLSDGSVVLAYRDWRQGLQELPGLGVLASDDGGRTLRELAFVTRWRGEPSEIGKYWFLPQLAVDASGGPLRDRLYAVWDDGNGPLRVRVLFAYSSDKGRSWSGPTILSEQPADGGSGYGAHMPTVAVNKDGVVAVTWYDRRGLPLVRGARSPYYGPGCNVRIRLSLDGGNTWQPSAQVNDGKPIRATVWELRDNAGLTADSDGVFHPVWSDDRTGVLQVWTAAVKVGKK